MLSDVNDEYMTSPFSAFLDGTPLLTFDDGPPEDSPYSADLNTPVMDMYDDAQLGGMYNGFGLFHDPATGMYEQTETKEVQKVEEKEQSSTPPTAAPATVHTSTDDTDLTVRRNTNVHTGTRRNLTPASLIPYDAPTQSRRYLTPSATSRRDGVELKRQRLNDSTASGTLFASGEDELADEELEFTHPDTDQLQKKRRQNTLAARKSRKRKLEHLLQLETENSELKREVEEWKSRFEVLEGLAKAYGLGLGPIKT
ncbi:hypothetical protein L218DRAFT_962678 [Marasmius fiardii PR-910]|nr:hypothetical protein L218DRAFT_962678 [Marasmius fiardii PR-910]